MKALKVGSIYVWLIVSICISPNLIGQESGEVLSHEGFFLRFLGGGGFGILVIDDVNGSAMSARERGSLFHVQAGREIFQNLALFGDLGAFAFSDPRVRYQGESFTSKGTEITSIAIGAGLTYYIMPHNVYLSGSVLMAKTQLEEPVFEEETELGPGILLCVGKEWWVGKKWGLGVAGFFEFHKLRSREETWGYKSGITNKIFGIAFTATLF